MKQIKLLILIHFFALICTAQRGTYETGSKVNNLGVTRYGVNKITPKGKKIFIPRPEFLPGFIIQNNGDTLRGLIKEKVNFSGEIKFIVNGTKYWKEYRAWHIKSYGTDINGKESVARVSYPFNSNTDYFYLSNPAKPNFLKFMSIDQEGSLTLLSVYITTPTSYNNNGQFMVTSGLIGKRYYLLKYGNHLIRVPRNKLTKKKFVTNFKYYISEEIGIKIENGEYTSIQEVVKEFNKQ